MIERKNPRCVLQLAGESMSLQAKDCAHPASARSESSGFHRSEASTVDLPPGVSAPVVKPLWNTDLGGKNGHPPADRFCRS